MFPVYGYPSSYPTQYAATDYDILAEEYESKAAHARLMAAREAAASRRSSAYELDPYVAYEQRPQHQYAPRRSVPRQVSRYILNLLCGADRIVVASSVLPPSRRRDISACVLSGGVVRGCCVGLWRA